MMLQITVAEHLRAEKIKIRVLVASTHSTMRGVLINDCLSSGIKNKGTGKIGLHILFSSSFQHK